MSSTSKNINLGERRSFKSNAEVSRVSAIGKVAGNFTKTQITGT